MASRESLLQHFDRGAGLAGMSGRPEVRSGKLTNPHSIGSRPSERALAANIGSFLGNSPWAVSVPEGPFSQLPMHPEVPSDSLSGGRHFPTLTALPNPGGSASAWRPIPQRTVVFSNANGELE